MMIPRMRRLSVGLAALTVVVLTSFSVLRAADPPMRVQLDVLKVTVDNKGVEQFTPATRVYPGEVLEYRLSYTNREAYAMTKVAATLPLPQGTCYLKNSATPAPQMASQDAVKFSPIPLKRKVTSPSGQVSEVEVPASEYLALRWIIDSLKPGKPVQLLARVTVANRG
ncbi:MAG: hypothetical protein ABFE07_26870 [Armatimonadia bacterium]